VTLKMRSSKSENMIFRANNQAVRCEISGKTQKACNPVSVLQSYRFNGWGNFGQNSEYVNKQLVVEQAVIPQE